MKTKMIRMNEFHSISFMKKGFFKTFANLKWFPLKKLLAKLYYEIY